MSQEPLECSFFRIGDKIVLYRFKCHDSRHSPSNGSNILFKSVVGGGIVGCKHRGCSDISNKGSAPRKIEGNTIIVTSSSTNNV